jgi:hypothetical protein
MSGSLFSGSFPVYSYVGLFSFDGDSSQYKMSSVYMWYCIFKPQLGNASEIMHRTNVPWPWLTWCRWRAQAREEQHLLAN